MNPLFQTFYFKRNQKNKQSALNNNKLLSKTYNGTSFQKRISSCVSNASTQNTQNPSTKDCLETESNIQALKYFKQNARQQLKHMFNTFDTTFKHSKKNNFNNNKTSQGQFFKQHEFMLNQSAQPVQYKLFDGKNTEQVSKQIAKEEINKFLSKGDIYQSKLLADKIKILKEQPKIPLFINDTEDDQSKNEQQQNQLRKSETNFNFKQASSPVSKTTPQAAISLQSWKLVQKYIELNQDKIKMIKEKVQEEFNLQINLNKQKQEEFIKGLHDKTQNLFTQYYEIQETIRQQFEELNLQKYQKEASVKHAEIKKKELKQKLLHCKLIKSGIHDLESTKKLKKQRNVANYFNFNDHQKKIISMSTTELNPADQAIEENARQQQLEQLQQQQQGIAQQVQFKTTTDNINDISPSSKEKDVSHNQTKHSLRIRQTRAKTKIPGDAIKQKQLKILRQFSTYQKIQEEQPYSQGRELWMKAEDGLEVRQILSRPDKRQKTLSSQQQKFKRQQSRQQRYYFQKKMPVLLDPKDMNQSKLELLQDFCDALSIFKKLAKASSHYHQLDKCIGFGNDYIKQQILNTRTCTVNPQIKAETLYEKFVVHIRPVPQKDYIDFIKIDPRISSKTKLGHFFQQMLSQDRLSKQIGASHQKSQQEQIEAAQIKHQRQKDVFSRMVWAKADGSGGIRQSLILIYNKICEVNKIMYSKDTQLLKQLLELQIKEIFNKEEEILRENFEHQNWDKYAFYNKYIKQHPIDASLPIFPSDMFAALKDIENRFSACKYVKPQVRGLFNVLNQTVKELISVSGTTI